MLAPSLSILRGPGPPPPCPPPRLLRLCHCHYHQLCKPTKTFKLSLKKLLISPTNYYTLKIDGDKNKFKKKVLPTISFSEPLCLVYTFPIMAPDFDTTIAD